jgi:hypothetical protein
LRITGWPKNQPFEKRSSNPVRFIGWLEGIARRKFMGTSAKQDRKFIDEIISTSLLEDAISWISKELSPEDVFKKDELVAWAEDNGFIKPE